MAQDRGNAAGHGHFSRHYSRDAILAMYLKEAYLRYGAYGLEPAAAVYFGGAP